MGEDRRRWHPSSSRSPPPSVNPPEFFLVQKHCFRKLFWVLNFRPPQEKNLYLLPENFSCRCPKIPSQNPGGAAKTGSRPASQPPTPLTHLHNFGKILNIAAEKDDGGLRIFLRVPKDDVVLPVIEARDPVQSLTP